jgi:hypothetical protein
MGLGLAWLAIATAMMAVSPSTLALPHAAPAVVALAHAWVLGVFLTVAAGAMYQLAPVALGTALWSERTGWWHLALHFAGVPGMVYAFERFDLRLLGLFGTLVAAGVGVFVVNIWGTIVRSGKRDAVAASLALAAGWLALTVLAGLFLVANKQWGWWPADPVALLRAHAHLGIVGFFVTLLQGVTFRLVPMFTLGEVPDWRPVRAGLWLSQLGLLGLAPALAWHARGWTAVSGTAVLAGVIASAVALRQTLGTRKKRQLDTGVRAFVRGMSALVGAGLAGVLLLWPAISAGSAPGGFGAMVYAVLVFAGGLLPTITGMMCKIVPFLTWMRAYGPKVGRGPTPAAGALSSPRLQAWAFALQGVGGALLVVGVWRLQTLLLRAGTWVMAASVVLFLADMLGVLKHLFQPAGDAAAAVKNLS